VDTELGLGFVLGTLGFAPSRFIRPSLDGSHRGDVNG
jgi:hypothetical protein